MILIFHLYPLFFPSNPGINVHHVHLVVPEIKTCRDT
jgi:hypothetical protein